MRTKPVVYYAKLSSKGQLTIPLKVREKLKLTQNDTVRFVLTDKEQFLIERFEVKMTCNHESNQEKCILCFNTGIIDISKSFFPHLLEIQSQYGYMIKLNLVEHGAYKLDSFNYVLSEHEQAVLLKWFEYQELRRE